MQNLRKLRRDTINERRAYPTIVHDQFCCSIWLAFDYDPLYSDCDLSPMMISPAPSNPPKGEYWLNFELDNSGYDFLCPSHTTVESGEGWVFARSWAQFALENGLAPHQAFQVRVAVDYSTCITDEGPEYDTNFDCVTTQVEPIAAQEACERWHDWVKSAADAAEHSRILMRELKRRQREDFEAMWTRVGSYWARNTWRDEMSMPDGISVKLETTHTSVPFLGKHSWGTLLEVKRDDGNIDKAMQDYKDACLKAFPGMDAEAVAKRRFSPDPGWRLLVQS